MYTASKQIFLHILNDIKFVSSSHYSYCEQKYKFNTNSIYLSKKKK